MSIVVAWLCLLPSVLIADPPEGNDIVRTPGDAWSMFRGNNAMTGVSDAKLPESLEQRWSVNTGVAIESTAAIVDGVVYVPNLDGRCFAFKLDTGDKIWEYIDPEQVGSKSSPTIHGDLVLFGDEMGIFRALDRKTGEERWRFEAEDKIGASPVVVDDKILVGSHDTFLYCLGLDGSLQWKAQTEGPVQCSATRVGDEVMVAGCDGFLRFIAIADGKETRKLELGGYIASTPALAGDIFYFGSMSNNNVLAVSRADLALVWTYETGRQFPFYSSPTVSEQLVYIGGQDKQLHAIRRADGQKEWTFRTRARIDSSPVLADGRIWFGSSDGTLHALDATTGAPRWTATLGPAITASPALVDNTLIIGDTDGILHCFSSK